MLVKAGTVVVSIIGGILLAANSLFALASKTDNAVIVGFLLKRYRSEM